MLKLEEILKRLEEIDKVVKSVENVKAEVMANIEQISRKYSEQIVKRVDEIVNNAVMEYKSKTIDEARKEAEKIIREAEEKRQKILTKYQEKREDLVRKALALLNL